MHLSSIPSRQFHERCQSMLVTTKSKITLRIFDWHMMKKKTSFKERTQKLTSKPKQNILEAFDCDY